MIRRIFWFSTGAAAVLAWQHRERLAEIIGGLLSDEPWIGDYEDEDDEDAMSAGLLAVPDPSMVEPRFELLITSGPDRAPIVEIVGAAIEADPGLELREVGDAIVVVGLSYSAAEDLSARLRGAGAMVTRRAEHA